MPITPGQDTMLGSSTPDGSDASSAIAAASLTGTCEIVENVGVTGLAYDGMGGFVDNWQVVRSYACLIVTVSGTSGSTEMLEAGRITAVGKFIVYLPIDAVLTPADRIRSDGVDYEVVDRPPQLASQVLLAVMVRWVE